MVSRCQVFLVTRYRLVFAQPFNGSSIRIHLNARSRTSYIFRKAKTYRETEQPSSNYLAHDSLMVIEPIDHSPTRSLNHVCAYTRQFLDKFPGSVESENG